MANWKDCFLFSILKMKESSLLSKIRDDWFGQTPDTSCKSAEAVPFAFEKVVSLFVLLLFALIICMMVLGLEVLIQRRI